MCGNTEGAAPGFTKKYGVKMLVHFESFEDVNTAIRRETRLKKWSRKWKLDLIESKNPEWTDLYEEMTASQSLPEWLVAANPKKTP